tara:strand:- start:5605 stop:5904 length:300 start_codon:yes stop_codon:yes gene_type:complete
MERGLYNRTTAGEATLLPIDGLRGDVNSIRLANYSSTESVAVDLYLYDLSGTNVYLMKGLVIPIGVSLLLDHELNFDNSVLGLKINLTGSNPRLSIIIK